MHLESDHVLFPEVRRGRGRGSAFNCILLGFPRGLPPPHIEHILALRIWEVGSDYVQSFSAKLGVSSSAPTLYLHP